MPKGGIGDYPYATFLSGKSGYVEKGSLQASLITQESLKARSKGISRKNKEERERRAATASSGQRNSESSLYSYQSVINTQSVLLRKGNGTAPTISHMSQWDRWDNSQSRTPTRESHKTGSHHVQWGAEGDRAISPMADDDETLGEIRSPVGPQPYGNASTLQQPRKFDTFTGALLFGEDDGFVIQPSYSISPASVNSQHHSPRNSDGGGSVNSVTSGGTRKSIASTREGGNRIGIDLIMPTTAIPIGQKSQTQHRSQPRQTPQLDPTTTALPILSPLRGNRASTAPLMRMEESRRRHSIEQSQQRMNQTAGGGGGSGSSVGSGGTTGTMRRSRDRLGPRSKTPQKSTLSHLSSSRSVLGVLMAPQPYDGFAEGTFNFRSASPTRGTYVPGDELIGGSPLEQLKRQARTPKKHYTIHSDPRPSLRSSMKPGTSTYLTLARK